MQTVCNTALIYLLNRVSRIRTKIHPDFSSDKHISRGPMREHLEHLGIGNVVRLLSRRSASPCKALALTHATFLSKLRVLAKHCPSESFPFPPPLSISDWLVCSLPPPTKPLRPDNRISVHRSRGLDTGADLAHAFREIGRSSDLETKRTVLLERSSPAEGPRRDGIGPLCDREAPR